MNNRLISGLLLMTLALVTLAALFLAQRLKQNAPLISNLELRPKVFSPRVKGRNQVRLIFKVGDPDQVTLGIVNDRDQEVRRLASAKQLEPGKHTFTWNGRDDRGQVVPDGRYRLQATLQRAGRMATLRREVVVNTKPPTPIVVKVKPPFIQAGSSPGGQVAIKYRGPKQAPPSLLIYRVVAGQTQLAGRATAKLVDGRAIWDGTLAGSLLAPGSYLIAVEVRNHLGTLGASFKGAKPRCNQIRGHPGIVVGLPNVQLANGRCPVDSVGGSQTRSKPSRQAPPQGSSS